MPRVVTGGVVGRWAGAGGARVRAAAKMAEPVMPDWSRDPWTQAAAMFPGAVIMDCGLGLNDVDMASAPVDRHVVALGRAGVELAGAADLLLGVGDHLVPLGDPAHRPRQSE